MRIMFVATLLAAALAGSSAFAQGSYTHHAFCLQTGAGKNCGYNTMAQCQAARRGMSTGSCIHNTAPMNH